MPNGEILAPVPVSKSRKSVWSGWAEAPRGSCTFMIELMDNGTIKALDAGQHLFVTGVARKI